MARTGYVEGQRQAVVGTELLEFGRAARGDSQQQNGEQPDGHVGEVLGHSALKQHTWPIDW